VLVSGTANPSKSYPSLLLASSTPAALNRCSWASRVVLSPVSRESTSKKTPALAARVNW
jgi:hypothetical protein